MNIKLELLQNYISDCISNYFENTELDETKIADTTAILALSEIKEIICNDALTDFEAIEDIISVFEKYKLDFGERHDF